MSGLVDYEDSDSDQDHPSGPPTPPTASTIPNSGELRKRKKPSTSTPGVVTISIPLPRGTTASSLSDEDEDDSGEARKRKKPLGSSLVSLLPPPKNTVHSTTPTTASVTSTSLARPVASLLARTQLLTSIASSSNHSQDEEGNETPSFSSKTPPGSLPQDPLQAEFFDLDGVPVVEIKQADLRSVTPVQLSIPAPSLPGPRLSSTQKKKNQIGYLASTALALEVELAEKKAAGLRSRNQSRSKYGW